MTQYFSDGVLLRAKAASATIVVSIGPTHRREASRIVFGPSQCVLTAIKLGSQVTVEVARLEHTLESFRLSSSDVTTFEGPLIVRGGQVALTFVNDTDEDAMTPNVVVEMRYDENGDA